MVRTARLCLCLILVALLAPAAARAGWGASEVLGPASSGPVIGYDFSGNAALAYAVSPPGKLAVVEHPRDGAFAAPTLVDTGSSDVGLPLQVVTVDGETVVAAGSTMFVRPAGSATFGNGQQLGGEQQFDLPPADAVLAPTPRGEVIASVMDNSGNEALSVLEPGATVFGPLTYPPAFAEIGGPAPVGVDAAGDAFITDPRNGGCPRYDENDVEVGYRPPNGKLRIARALHCSRESVATQPPSALAAAGNGRTVLVTVTGRFRDYTMLVQRGHGTQFSAPVVLGHSDEEPNFGAPAIGRSGGVTVEWNICNVSGRRCAAHVASGSLRGGAWQQHRYTVPGNGAASGYAGVGFVPLQSCTPRRCSISVAYAGRSGFSRPGRLTRDGSLVYPDPFAAATSGRAHPSLIVWLSSADGLFAAALDSRSHRFGHIHRLAPDGQVMDGAVHYETSRYGQAMVSWLNSDGTVSAAAYSA